jgi:AbiU2
MWTDNQIDAAAAAAAEKANGGKFSDPLFYAPEHRKFWRDVVRTALDVADETPKQSDELIPEVSHDEVRLFSDHCVHIRSVYEYATRLFRDSDDLEQGAMKAVAPRLFDDLVLVLTEFLVNAVCRITDQPADWRGNENFTVGLFANSFVTDQATYQKLDELRDRMLKHRYRLLLARNKLGAHADRAVIKKGEPLGAASWKEWDQFWFDLADFVRLLNEKTFGSAFEIEAAMVRGDAEMLIKAVRSIS